MWDTLLVRLHHVCHIARMIRLQQSMQTAGFDGLGHRVLVEQHLVAFRIRLRVGEVIAGWGVEGGGEASREVKGGAEAGRSFTKKRIAGAGLEWKGHPEGEVDCSTWARSWAKLGRARGTRMMSARFCAEKMGF